MQANAQSCPRLNARLRELENRGFLILEDLLVAGEVSALRDQLSPWLAQTPRCEGDFYGWNTTRVGGLLTKAPVVQDIVMHPEILPIAESLLGPACDCIQLNLTQATRVHPGERAQAPHRDEEMWPVDTKGRHYLLNVMWAVDEFTAENGATRLWPGSHRCELDRELDPAASVSAEMPAGSALVFLGSLTHGAGANCASRPRTGVIVSYCLGWLKTYENQFLAYSKDEVRTFSEPLQRLMGYRMHRPNLGNWEGQDPIKSLDYGAVSRPHIDALTPEIAEQLRQMRLKEDESG